MVPPAGARWVALFAGCIYAGSVERLTRTACFMLGMALVAISTQDLGAQCVVVTPDDELEKIPDPGSRNRGYLMCNLR